MRRRGFIYAIVPGNDGGSTFDSGDRGEIAFSSILYVMMFLWCIYFRVVICIVMGISTPLFPACALSSTARHWSIQIHPD